MLMMGLTGGDGGDDDDDDHLPCRNLSLVTSGCFLCAKRRLADLLIGSLLFWQDLYLILV